MRRLFSLICCLLVFSAGAAWPQIKTQVVNGLAVVTCSAQFARSIAANGVATCATVALATDVSGTLPATNVPTPKIITVSRDMTAVTGNVAYTGCGFSPRLLTATGGVSGATSDRVTFLGLIASGGAVGNAAIAGTVVLVNSNFIEAFETGLTNGQSAGVNSFDADGFTLAWTKTGTPGAGTATFYVSCFDR